MPETLIENRVEKRGNRWCVVHGHPKKPGSKTDKPEGTIIKCFSSREKALAMHRAIMANNEGDIMFTNVTANLKADKAKTRYETLEGKQHLVVPCIMLTEGVHEGSMGPLYYPAEELSKTPAIWNGKPVVVYHPQFNGQSVSACDPVIFETQKVGQLFNTRWEDGKLKTECWIDEEKANQVDERVMQAIENGQMMEVSTGLFTDNEEIDGEWNGEKYGTIARNYRPDHLAILPDLKGACSIEDGAGLLRNQQLAEIDGTPEAFQALGKSIAILARGEGQGVGGPKQGDGGTDTCVCPKCGATTNHDRGTPCSNKACPKCGTKMVGKGTIKNAMQAFREVIENELSHNEVRDKLADKIGGDFVYVMDVYETYFIYEKDNKLYHQEYNINNGEVKLNGLRNEVERVVQYKKGDGTFVGNAEMKTEGGRKYPASAYAYVPDRAKPSTWKLRLWETPDKKETASQVGRAVAAIGKGFRGNKVQIPASAMAGVKAKIRSAWRRTNPDKKASDMPSVLKNVFLGKDIGMDKEKVVNELISNEKSPWTEEDREGLMELSEEKLACIVNGLKEEEEPAKKVEPKGDEPKGDENAPTDNKEVTMDEFISNAPKEYQDVLRSGLEAHKVQKAELIKKITANKNNTFSPEQLDAFGMKELSQIANLAKVEEAKPAPVLPAPLYGGMQEVVSANQQAEEEPLEAPVMNFDAGE